MTFPAPRVSHLVMSTLSMLLIVFLQCNLLLLPGSLDVCSLVENVVLGVHDDRCCNHQVPERLGTSDLEKRTVVRQQSVLRVTEHRLDSRHGSGGVVKLQLQQRIWIFLSLFQYWTITFRDFILNVWQRMLIQWHFR